MITTSPYVPTTGRAAEAIARRRSAVALLERLIDDPATDGHLALDAILAWLDAAGFSSPDGREDWTRMDALAERLRGTDE